MPARNLTKPNRGCGEAVSIRAPAGQRKLPAGALGIADLIATLAERRLKAREDAEKARRRAVARRRGIDRSKAELFEHWMSARMRLREAVVAIDAELGRLGCYLSMSDDTIAPPNLAAVEICLCIDGQRCEILFDLTVTGDGHQVARDVGGRKAPRPVALPPIQRVTRDDYCTALLAYVDRAMAEETDRAVDLCRECGRQLAAAGWVEPDGE